MIKPASLVRFFMITSFLLVCTGCESMKETTQQPSPSGQRDNHIGKWSSMTLPEKESLVDAYRNDKMRFERMTEGRAGAHGLSVMLKSAQGKGDAVWVNLVLLPGDCVSLPSAALPVKAHHVECCLESDGLAFRHPSGSRLFWLPEHPQWRTGMLFPLSKPPEMGKMLIRLQLLGVQPGFSSYHPS